MQKDASQYVWTLQAGSGRTVVESCERDNAKIKQPNKNTREAAVEVDLGPGRGFVRMYGVTEEVVVQFRAKAGEDCEEEFLLYDNQELGRAVAGGTEMEAERSGHAYELSIGGAQDWVPGDMVSRRVGHAALDATPDVLARVSGRFVEAPIGEDGRNGGKRSQKQAEPGRVLARET